SWSKLLRQPRQLVLSSKTAPWTKSCPLWTNKQKAQRRPCSVTFSKAYTVSWTPKSAASYALPLAVVLLHRCTNWCGRHCRRKVQSSAGKNNTRGAQRFEKLELIPVWF